MRKRAGDGFNKSLFMFIEPSEAIGSQILQQAEHAKRAQVVKDLLVKKYGIPADNLKVAAGGGVDKFGQPILNRVVLVESEK